MAVHQGSLAVYYSGLFCAAIFYLVYTDLLVMCGEFLGDLYQPVCFVQLAASATFCTEPAGTTSWLESRRALAATSAGGHESPT